jgi:uncharacterized membrane protein YecN with MAPEG domain
MSMALVYLVLLLSLIQYFAFGLAVGRARGRYGVAAPATTGHPDFERIYRVQMNTLEQLVLFVPALLLFADLVDPLWAAGLGMVFVVGRMLYAIGYAQAANKRHLGFGLSALPVVVMLLGSLFAAGRAALGLS